MTEENATFRKLLHEKQHRNIYITSPGEIRTVSVQTGQRKDSIHVHPGKLMQLWGFFAGAWVRSNWQSWVTPKQLHRNSVPSSVRKDLVEAAL